MIQNRLKSGIIAREKTEKEMKIHGKEEITEKHRGGCPHKLP